jgi:hypothetical protein
MDLYQCHLPGLLSELSVRFFAEKDNFKQAEAFIHRLASCSQAPRLSVAVSFSISANWLITSQMKAIRISHRIQRGSWGFGPAPEEF